MIPSWALELPWSLMSQIARTEKVPVFLIAVIVQTESSGHTFATRYERGWKWFSDPEAHAKRLGLSVDSEVVAQATSFGLMQIMGGTARGLGFDGFLPELTKPEVGLTWGARYLARQLTRYPNKFEAIASYNAGSPRYRPDGKVFENQGYVDKVFKRLQELKGVELDLS